MELGLLVCFLGMHEMEILAHLLIQWLKHHSGKCLGAKEKQSHGRKRRGNTKPCEFVISLWPWPVGCSSHPSEESIYKLTLTAHECSDVTCDQRIFFSWGGHFPNPGNGASCLYIKLLSIPFFFFFFF
ncbi:hypothetical protein AAHE18_11G168300 [Arachis hypogaea]